MPRSGKIPWYLAKETWENIVSEIEAMFPEKEGMIKAGNSSENKPRFPADPLFLKIF